MRRIEYPDLTATVTEHSECAPSCEHVDDRPRLVITLEGHAIDRGPGHAFSRERFSALFRPAGTAHRVAASRDSSVVTIRVRRERLAIIGKVTAAFARPVYAPPQALGPLPAELSRALQQPDEDEGALRLESIVLAIVARLAAVFRRSRDDVRPPWLDDALSLLARKHHAGVNRGDIARVFGVTPTALAEALVTYEGRTFEEILRSIRIERARELLATTSLGIADVAHATGFYDHAHLSHAFRKVYGMSPSDFRRSLSNPR